MIIQSKMKTLLCPQHFPHYKSMGEISDVQGQVISQQIVRFGRKSNLCAILCLPVLPVSFTKIRSKMKTLYHVPNIFSCAQGRVTPKPIVRCGRSSNSSESLCLSWLPANLMTIQSKMKVLLCPHDFLHYTYMGNISGAQGRGTPKRVVRSGPTDRLRFYACPGYLQV